MVGSGVVPRFTEDAGFLLANLNADTTGVVGAVIWIAAGEFSADEAHLGPRILVVAGTELSVQSLAGGVAVTLARPATIVGSLPDKIRWRSRSFAEMNQAVLLEYWRGEIDTKSAIERLERVRSGRA